MSSGVGEFSKPGGHGDVITGDGTSMRFGEHSDRRIGLAEVVAFVLAAALSHLDRGDTNRTKVGESSGDAGGVRFSLERR